MEKVWANSVGKRVYFFCRTNLGPFLLHQSPDNYRVRADLGNLLYLEENNVTSEKIYFSAQPRFGPFVKANVLNSRLTYIIVVGVISS